MAMTSPPAPSVFFATCSRRFHPAGVACISTPSKVVDAEERAHPAVDLGASRRRAPRDPAGSGSGDLAGSGWKVGLVVERVWVGD